MSKKCKPHLWSYCVYLLIKHIILRRSSRRRSRRWWSFSVIVFSTKRIFLYLLYDFWGFVVLFYLLQANSVPYIRSSPWSSLRCCIFVQFNSLVSCQQHVCASAIEKYGAKISSGETTPLQVGWNFTSCQTKEQTTLTDWLMTDWWWWRWRLRWRWRWQ